MKRLLLLFLVTVAAHLSYAQVPQTLSYQGILVDNLGAPVTDGNGNNVHFEFYDALTAGNLLYQTGTITGITTFKGMFTVTIGTGTAANPVIPTNIWGQKVFVQVQANGNTLTPRIELTASPYAFMAQTANTMDAAGLTGTIASTVLDADLQDLADGSLTGSKVGTGISAANITTGSLTGSLVGTGINASNITTGTLTGSLVGTGINAANITTGTITSAQITDGTIVAGDLASNTVTSAKMTTTGVVANTYGSATAIPIVTVDASGRLTSVTTAAIGGGTVTNVTATGPLSVLNGTTTPAISIPKVTPAVDGYLAAADFAAFSAKQGAITASNGLTLTTNTLTLGGTMTANTTLTSGGFSFNYAGAGNFGISVPTPLSKLDVGGSMAVGNGYAGVVAAPTNGIIVQGNVGIGTNAPAAKLDVAGTFKLLDGTQGLNKVLVSDASGNASWKNSSINTSFSVYATTTTSVTSAAQVVFAGEDYDDGGNFAANAYTAPTAGVYHFDCQLRIAGALVDNSYMYFYFAVNGSLRKDVTGVSSTATWGIGGGVDLKLNAGDLVSIYLYGGSNTLVTQTGTVNTWFSGHRVY